MTLLISSAYVQTYKLWRPERGIFLINLSKKKKKGEDRNNILRLRITLLPNFERRSWLLTTNLEYWCGKGRRERRNAYRYSDRLLACGQKICFPKELPNFSCLLIRAPTLNLRWDRLVGTLLIWTCSLGWILSSWQSYGDLLQRQIPFLSWSTHSAIGTTDTVSLSRWPTVSIFPSFCWQTTFPLFIRHQNAHKAVLQSNSLRYEGKFSPIMPGLQSRENL